MAQNTNLDLPLATKFKGTSVVFWEGADAQYEREVYSASELLRVRPLVEVGVVVWCKGGKAIMNDKVNAKGFSNEDLVSWRRVRHITLSGIETNLRIIRPI
jgi:hypothetical protein